MNVTQERLINLRATALRVCDLLRKKEPVPTELVNSLEGLASRKLKDQDPRMFEMFAAGKPVKDIAAELGVTPTSIYIHRRRWLEKNQPHQAVVTAAPEEKASIDGYDIRPFDALRTTVPIN